jgi:diguanylate cyclase (GGDEF)-like protein/PAS domain S-box-containing protein
VTAEPLHDPAALQSALRLLQAQWRAVDHGVRDVAFHTVDAEGVVAAWSDSAARVYLREAAEVVGRPMATLAPDDGGDERAVQALLATAVRNGWSEAEGTHRRGDGSTFRAALVVTLLDVGDGVARFQVITRDLSERRRQEATAPDGAPSRQDELTGVMTHRVFHDQAITEIARARRYGQPLTMLLVDPDHLTALNEAHGTALGDECLRVIADVCREESRTTDMIGRVGGEAFALLLPMTDLSGGLVLAERIRERVQRHVFGGAHASARCTVCVGVAELAVTASSADALLALARMAVQRAKQSGRNLVVGLDD